MKMPWNREAVRILPTKIDLAGQPWCRDALLLHIRGTGVLRWERRLLLANADLYETPLCLTLRGAPLLSWLAAVCETSESWLCTGWGLDTAECPELDALREILNGGFAQLENAVPALSPLLELLPEGMARYQEGHQRIQRLASRLISEMGEEKILTLLPLLRQAADSFDAMQQEVT